MNYSMLAGVDVTESVRAVALVERPKPRTLDMQNLVGCVGVRQEYKPAIYQTEQGIIAHPAILRSIREKFSLRADQAMRGIFGL